MFSSLSGAVKFKNIWKEASVCVGMVSKRERLVSKIKGDYARLRGLSAAEGSVSLQGPTDILKSLIISMRFYTLPIGLT